MEKTTYKATYNTKTGHKSIEGLTAHPDMATADIVQATEVSPDDLVSSDSQLDNQETYTLKDGKLELDC
jgi:hypothetical protein